MSSLALKSSWVRGGSVKCPQCGEPKHRMRWACANCDAAYHRAYRRTHKPKPRQGEALLRERARAYANVYLRRGKIERQPCFGCGSDQAKMRHADFSKPLEVAWFCDACEAAWPR